MVNLTWFTGFDDHPRWLVWDFFYQQYCWIYKENKIQSPLPTALSPLLAFPIFSGIVRVGSILRSFLLVLSSPRSSLVLGGTVVRTRTWLLPFGLGCALSRIACGTPVSLGVLLTPFSKPVLVLSSCPFQRSVSVIRGWDTSKFVTL